jgi:hypothetical protein
MWDSRLGCPKAGKMPALHKLNVKQSPFLSPSAALSYGMFSMLDSVASPPSVASTAAASSPSIIQPIGVKALYGLAIAGDALLAVDPFRGYLLRIDPLTGNTQILNSCQAEAFERATGIAHWQGQIWFVRDHIVYTTPLDALDPQPVLTLPYPADGVAVWENTLYVSCKKAGCILSAIASRVSALPSFRPRASASKISPSGATISGSATKSSKRSTVWIAPRAN